MPLMKCKKWLGVAFLLSYGVIANAANVTYTYTGNDFTSTTLPSSYTTSDSVTGFITLAAPLAANINSFPATSLTPVSFSISNGVQTINTLASGDYFGFKTDASGNISQWQVAVNGTNLHISTVNFPGVLGVFDSTSNNADTDGAQNLNLAGTWSISAVPEADTYAMMVAGLGLIGLRLRRRADSVKSTSA